MAIWNQEQSIILIVAVWATAQMGLWFLSNLRQVRSRRRR